MILTKAQQKSIAAYAKTPVEDQAKIYLRNLERPGMYWFLPMIAWIEPMEPPTMMISGALLQIADQSIASSAIWKIPTTAPNREPLCTLLCSLGWEGAVWPRDGGWPTGAPEEDGLKAMLDRVPISNTLMFAVDPVKGNRVIKTLITSTQGTPLLSPAVAPDDIVQPSPEIQTKFAEIVADPAFFMPPALTAEQLTKENENRPSIKLTR